MWSKGRHRRRDGPGGSSMAANEADLSPLATKGVRCVQKQIAFSVYFPGAGLPQRVDM